MNCSNTAIIRQLTFLATFSVRVDNVLKAVKFLFIIHDTHCYDKLLTTNFKPLCKSFPIVKRLINVDSNFPAFILCSVCLNSLIS